MSEFQVDTEYLLKAAEQTKLVKEQTYRLLNLDAAQTVLDIGCGPGVDLIRMAELTSPGVQIIGIDFDPQMVRDAINATESKGLQNRIRIVEGSVFSLPFEDSTMDRIRAERLFQVLPDDPETEISILNEMIRVLKPGGILVLADTDWATASVDFSDTNLERRLIRFFGEQRRPNGLGARRFYSLLKSRNLQQLDIQAMPVIMHAFSEMDPLYKYIAEEALKDRIINESEAENWVTEIEQKSKSGALFASVNMNIVKGINPS